MIPKGMARAAGTRICRKGIDQPLHKAWEGWSGNTPGYSGPGKAQVRLRPGVLRRAKETNAVRVSLYSRGKAVPVCGYGEGVYYRLGRQPLWLIRQRGHTKTDGSLCQSRYWWNSAACALGERLGGSGDPMAYPLFT